jgi:hypothetical protein
MDEPDLAFWHGVWRAILATIICIVLTACYSANVGGALLIAANVALIYTLIMMVDAPRWAPEAAQLHVLRFAKAGSAVSMALASFALLA